MNKILAFDNILVMIIIVHGNKTVSLNRVVCCLCITTAIPLPFLES
jgi:predicted tellurium resistance membrane protein TerC